MVNFYGQHRVTIDAKNRVMLPSRLRDQAGDVAHWVLTRGLDKCLALYTPDRWEGLVAKVTEASFTRKRARQFQRMLFSKAIEVECDKAGRFLIPEYLKTSINLSKKVVFVGLADRIELWDSTTWDKMEELLEDDFENLAEDLFSS